MLWCIFYCTVISNMNNGPREPPLHGKPCLLRFAPSCSRDPQNNQWKPVALYGSGLLVKIIFKLLHICDLHGYVFIVSFFVVSVRQIMSLRVCFFKLLKNGLFSAAKFTLVLSVTVVISSTHYFIKRPAILKTAHVLPTSVTIIVYQRFYTYTDVFEIITVLK